jgi:hypothetical protein
MTALNRPAGGVPDGSWMYGQGQEPLTASRPPAAASPNNPD